MDKSMTGMIDRLIKEAGLGGKNDHTGAYQKGFAKVVAEQVHVVYPEREIKVLQALFFSRRAVIQQKADKALAKAQAEPVPA